jgi:hypothetical protein
LPIVVTHSMEVQKLSILKGIHYAYRF